MLKCLFRRLFKLQNAVSKCKCFSIDAFVEQSSDIPGGFMQYRPKMCKHMV